MRQLAADEHQVAGHVRREQPGQRDEADLVNMAGAEPGALLVTKERLMPAPAAWCIQVVPCHEDDAADRADVLEEGIGGHEALRRRHLPGSVRHEGGEEGEAPEDHCTGPSLNTGQYEQRRANLDRDGKPGRRRGGSRRSAASPRWRLRSRTPCSIRHADTLRTVRARPAVGVMGNILRISVKSTFQPLSLRLGNCNHEVYEMTKRIERNRIESGKIDLPRKLGFLTSDKVDFLSVTDRNGEFSVEMSVAALSKLVKAKGELKALKGEQKSAAAGHASALQAEKDAHAETQAALAKAERRIKALTKKLEGATPSKDAAAAGAAKATNGAVPKVAKTAAVPIKAAVKGQPRAAKSATAGAAPGNGTPSTIESIAPAAPKKVSSKKAVAKAAEAIVAPAAAAQGPAALH